MGSCVNTIIVLAIFVQVHGNLCPYDGDLTANDKPRITVFNQSLQEPTEYFSRSSEGIECLWTIKAKESDKLVRLKFDSFVMLRSSEYKDEDCVSIYDGDYSHSSLDRENLIQKLCEKMPEPVYNSSGRYLTVIFTQGGHGGWRWMTMNYTMVEQVPYDGFWTTTVGRVISFAIVIVIFGVFSYIFKACKHGGSLSDTCRSITRRCDGCCYDIRRTLRRVTSCHLLSKFRTRRRAAAEEPREVTISRERNIRGASDNISRSSFDNRSEISIATISGADGSASGPDLSSFTISASNPHDVSSHAPPPDYSSVVQETPDRGSDITVVPSAPPEFGGLSGNDDFLPLPDDDTAPPSYQAPPPPSYESLFDSTV